MAAMLRYGLYFLVPALLLVVSAWLALTLYIVWKRRKYAHIPSPKLPRYIAVCVAFLKGLHGHQAIISEAVSA